MQNIEQDTEETLNRERSEVLARVECWLELPMIVLGFAWLALLVIELTWGLSPVTDIIARAIWILFVVEFALKLILAPRKLAFVRINWLTVIALIIPALRVFRLFAVVKALRVARVARSLRLLRLVSSLNRGMKALGASMARRGLGYVIALTTIVTFAGAAGMYAFERDVPGAKPRLRVITPRAPAPGHS